MSEGPGSSRAMARVPPSWGSPEAALWHSPRCVSWPQEAPAGCAPGLPSRETSAQPSFLEQNGPLTPEEPPLLCGLPRAAGHPPLGQGQRLWTGSEELQEAWRCVWCLPAGLQPEQTGSSWECSGCHPGCHPSLPGCPDVPSIQ